MEHPTPDDQKVLKHLTQILFFPSWSKLIGSEYYLGSYLNQPVIEILKDNVVFLPDQILTGEEEDSEEAFVVLTGVGLYYTQFRVTPKMINTDFRELTCLLISLDDYEKAQDISTSIINSENLRMTELMISIPFALILARQTTQMFMRGVIARNVVHPYKDCFDELVRMCNNPNTLSSENGYKLLSGGGKFTNHLLTEKILDRYSQVTAGLKAVETSANIILDSLQLTESRIRLAIFEKIRLIKRDFVDVGYPRLMDWTP
ncbi:hypothetical protein [Candidatus Hodarchaeum mangrovi]